MRDPELQALLDERARTMLDFTLPRQEASSKRVGGVSRLESANLPMKRCASPS